MTELELQEKLVSIEKLQTETHKLVIESQKLAADTLHAKSKTLHIDKKNKWFEFTLVLALVAATVAVTKLFL